MSSSSRSTKNDSDNPSGGRYCGAWGGSGNWSGLNIAAMVIGFVIFWPIGLAVLFWNLTGRSVKDLPDTIRHQWSKVSGYWNNHDSYHSGGTDNSVFNDFQQTQFDRVREIKDEIKERSHRFGEFRSDAKRRADEEEFNRFMSDTPGRAES